MWGWIALQKVDAPILLLDRAFQKNKQATDPTNQRTNQATKQPKQPSNQSNQASKQPSNHPTTQPKHAHYKQGNKQTSKQTSKLHMFLAPQDLKGPFPNNTKILRMAACSRTIASPSGIRGTWVSKTLCGNFGSDPKRRLATWNVYRDDWFVTRQKCLKRFTPDTFTSLS